MFSIKNRTLSLSTIIIITLLVFSIYTATVSSVHAADMPIQEKAAQILSSTAGFDTKTCQISVDSIQNNQYLGKPTKEATLNLASSEGNLRANCVFINEKMQRMYISGYSDLPSYCKPAAVNTVQAAKSFLQEYQKLDAQAIYSQCVAMMENVDAKSNMSKSAQNIRFAVTNFDDKIVDYSWMYVGEDGIVVGAKNVYLSFERGQLKTFINNWPFYTVVGSAKISGEEATKIAIEAVKNFSYEVTDGNATSTVSGFKVAPASIVNATLSYMNLRDADKARGGDPFTLYPSYYVPLGFDRVYPCGVTGVYVAVWADTGEVSVMSPMAVDYPETSAAEAVGKAPVQEPAQDVATSTFSFFALGSGAVIIALVVLSYKKVRYMPKVIHKSFSLKLFTVLLCVLILSSGAIAAMPLAGARATNKAETYGAIYKPHPVNSVDEKVACAEVCANITTAFENAGYDASNYCPTKEHPNEGNIGKETDNNTVLSNAHNDEVDYDNVAVFSFGHLADFNKAIQSGHLVDDESDWGNETNPTLNITASEVKAQTTQGKHFFVLIWHCVQAINPYSGSMAAAWTQRDGSPGHPYLSSDGYNNPDPMGQCYIGFSGYSPMIAYPTFYNGIPDKNMSGFIKDFYGYALDVNGYTVKEALDFAAQSFFGNSSFSQCPLVMHDHDTWWPGGPPAGQARYFNHSDPQYQSVMRVFGDGTVKLTAPPEMVNLHITDRDNQGNVVNGYVSIDGYFAGQTGMTIRIKAGTHTISVIPTSWYSWSYFKIGTQEYKFGSLTYYFAGDTTLEVRYVWNQRWMSPVPPLLIISVNGGGTTYPEPGPINLLYYTEENITIWAIPDYWYTFDHWLLNGEEELGPEYNPLTIPKQQGTLEAYFTQRSPENYTLTVSSGGNGTTNPAPDTYEKQEATTAEVTAEPDSGYVLDYWLLDNQSAGADQTIYVAMYGNRTLQAIFREAINYNLTIACGENGETAPQAGVHEALEGTSFGVTASPDTGYAVYWLLDSELYSSNQSVTVPINSNHVLEAVFVDEDLFDAFGNTEIFEEQRVVSNTSESWILGQVFTCPVSGVALSMTAAVKSMVPSEYIYVRYAIYWLSDFSLIAETEYGVVETQGWYLDPEWQTLAFPDPKPVLQEGVDYVLVVAGVNDPYGVYVAFDYAEAEDGVEQYHEFGLWYYEEVMYGFDFPQPLEPSSNWEKYSVYCTVMPAAPTPQYYLTVSSGGHGTTDPSPSVYQCAENAQVNVTAVPSSGYLFDIWLLNGVPYTQNPTATVTMTHNYTLEAVFTAPDYYWMSSINSYNGPVSDPENLTGCQNDGAFAVLQGNATQQQFGWIVGVLNAAATGHIYVYGYRCEGWDGQLSVYVSANGNDWNCVSDLYINNTWLDWVDCGVSTVPFSYVRLTSEDSEMTSCVCLDCVRVNLLVYNYTLTVSCGENGVTDPSAGTYESIMEGTPVEVTAEADSGYVFDYWLLDGNSSAQNPITVTMYCNHTLQANFRVAQYYDLTISSGSGGSTDPSPDTYEDIMEGTPVEVTANADTGFLFDHWLLDENYYAQNPISVVMNGNHALEAVFVEDPDYYWLSVEAVDLVCENEVYPDVYVDYEYVGAAPLSVRVLDGNVVVEVDEYAWCSHCERDCLLYFITYGEYYGQYYGEFFSNVVEIPIESDTSVWAVYLSQYKR